MIRLFLAAALAFSAAATSHAQDANEAAAYKKFLEELWVDAKAKGISRANFDLAFNGLSPDPRVIAATKRQPEYGKPVGDYVNMLVSTRRIEEGRRKQAEWQKTLDAVEKRFQVERWILISIWGIESSFGAAKDKWDVFRSLSTLAFVKYRHPYFRNELLVTLKIMQDGHIARKDMVSSWAGAMGQTQFMPTNFVDFAIDFSGDGKPDIWNNVSDVLGSTGNYLKKGGWKFGLPWGYEVTVPSGFDYKKSRGSFADWAKLNVKRADGGALPGTGDAILFWPAGSKGPGFLVTANYDVLKEYNNSDAYAIAIGHLADRMAGGPPIKAPWPTDDRPLSRDSRIALQKKLHSLGYKVNTFQGNFQGHVDFDLRDNIRDEQIKLGMVPDGNSTPEFMDRIGLTGMR
ncbi:MAG: lytic murein transglycosylase [Pseudolabrys sp.]|nr:lytic murein transglycosylase [Pseudolabrys sp.]